MRGASEERREELESLLTRPPAGEDPEPDDPTWSADAELDAFRSAQAAAAQMR